MYSMPPTQPHCYFTAQDDKMTKASLFIKRINDCSAKAKSASGFKSGVSLSVKCPLCDGVCQSSSLARSVCFSTLDLVFPERSPARAGWIPSCKSSLCSSLCGSPLLLPCGRAKALLAG